MTGVPRGVSRRQGGPLQRVPVQVRQARGPRCRRGPALQRQDRPDLWGAANFFFRPRGGRAHLLSRHPRGTSALPCSDNQDTAGCCAFFNSPPARAVTPSLLFFLSSPPYTSSLLLPSIPRPATMASVTRLSNSALRASLKAPAFNGRTAAFNAVRCYSAKTQVGQTSSRAQTVSMNPKLNRPSHPQTLKERFAEILPEKVEQIKALRKYVSSPPFGPGNRARSPRSLHNADSLSLGSTAPRSSTR